MSQELYKQQCIDLLSGISPAAWAVIESVAKPDLPVFQFREASINGVTAMLPADAQTLALMAAVRDGEIGLFKKLLVMRKHGEIILSEQQ